MSLASSFGAGLYSTPVNASQWQKVNPSYSGILEV
jgi:hypothetical protein